MIDKEQIISYILEKETSKLTDAALKKSVMSSFKIGRSTFYELKKMAFSGEVTDYNYSQPRFIDREIKKIIKDKQIINKESEISKLYEKKYKIDEKYKEYKYKKYEEKEVYKAEKERLKKEFMEEEIKRGRIRDAEIEIGLVKISVFHFIDGMYYKYIKENKRTTPQYINEKFNEEHYLKRTEIDKFCKTKQKEAESRIKHYDDLYNFYEMTSVLKISNYDTGNVYFQKPYKITRW